ncbi:MAG: diguanylate cyclase [Xanthomonadaceae bacterium]|nr:diguanylate cyclase [Xanthomonadaceae bacterium]
MFFDRQLKVEVERAHRQKSTLSLLMIDIDNFKKFNDHHSHQSGDNALREMGVILPEKSRTIDTVCRYGGEEFTIILPNTDHIKAFLIGERLRKAAEEHPFIINHNKSVNITLSLGIASYPEMASSDYDLVRKADLAMYEAKRLGKNRVVLYSPQLEGSKKLDDRKKGINLNNIDFFMEAIRSLADTRKLMSSLLSILLPSLDSDQSLYFEIDLEAKKVTLITSQSTLRSKPDNCCISLPFSSKFKECMTQFQTPRHLSTEEKHQLMISIPNGPTYPWDHVYCHPHRMSNTSTAFLLLFLADKKTPMGESLSSTLLTNHLNEAIELISFGLKAQQQQHSFYRLAAHKLISLSEIKLPYYQHHSAKVSRLLAQFSQQLELAEDITRSLADTAYFYDLGLMSISSNILLKDTPLTNNERKICQRHPLISWEIARFSPSTIKLDKAAILHHHESYDGSGYPDQLSGNNIPITARILALVDTYAAITSKRPYRKARSSEQTIQEISALAGIRFDPTLAKEFCSFVKAAHA